MCSEYQNLSSGEQENGGGNAAAHAPYSWLDGIQGKVAGAVPGCSSQPKRRSYKKGDPENAVNILCRIAPGLKLRATDLFRMHCRESSGDHFWMSL